MMDEINTSWIWADVASGGVKGARVDLARGATSSGLISRAAPAMMRFSCNLSPHFLAAGPNRQSCRRCRRRDAQCKLERMVRSIEGIRDPRVLNTRDEPAAHIDSPCRVVATINLRHGPVAQLGERHNGIVEVRGSSPLRSTVQTRVD